MKTLFKNTIRAIPLLFLFVIQAMFMLIPAWGATTSSPENMTVFTFMQENFGVICLIFFLILSEILAFKPAWGQSGIIKLILLPFLKSEARKAAPDVAKLVDSEPPGSGANH